MEDHGGSDRSNPPRTDSYRSGFPRMLDRPTLAIVVFLWVVAMLFGWNCWIGTAPAEGATVKTWIPYKISTVNWNQPPLIHGNNVAWVGLAGNHYQVFVHNITTGVTSQITYGTAWKWANLDIQGNWLAMQADDGSQSDIFLYEIAAKNLTRLTTTNLSEEHPSISSGRVVWSGYDGQDWELFMYDTGNGQTTQLTSNAGTDEEGPQFDGMWVVSTGYWTPASKYVSVFLTSIDGSLNRLLRTDAPDLNPHVRGNFVVWERHDPGGGVDIYLHDIALQKTKNLTPAVGTGVDTHPSMDGGRIVWERWDGNDYELVLYDIAAGTTTQLTNNSFSDYSPDLSGNDLVWSADPDYPWADVYYRDLGQPGFGPVERLTIDPLARNLFPRVDNKGRVVWLRQGDDYEVFLARKVDIPVIPVVPVLPIIPGNPVVPGNPVTQFTDVPASHPYTAAIHGLRGMGVVDGYTDNTFRPENNLLRAQFAKMIVEVLQMPDAQGAQVNEGMTAPFNDLGPDDLQTLYPHEYVAVIASQNVTVGTAPGLFSPWLNITRAQMITMVVRAAQTMKPGLLGAPPPGYQGSLGSFSPTHAANMQRAQHNGLLAGLVGFGPAWDPWKATTRGECAQVLWNLVQKMGP